LLFLLSNIFFFLRFEFSTFAQPSRAVEYLDVQIARLRLNDDNWVYGSSKLSEKVAIAVNPNNGELIRVFFEFK